MNNDLMGHQLTLRAATCAKTQPPIVSSRIGRKWPIIKGRRSRPSPGRVRTAPSSTTALRKALGAYVVVTAQPFSIVSQFAAACRRWPWTSCTWWTAGASTWTGPRADNLSCRTGSYRLCIYLFMFFASLTPFSVLVNLCTFVFSRHAGGTSGHQLDILAREALFSVGLNYGHGTGHGVGSFLCVHEYVLSLA
jgi:hypothetical protein